MKELVGNLFMPESYQLVVEGKPVSSKLCYPDAICITTNGFTKRNGDCVMGRGCAKQAKEMWPKVPFDLGKLIRKNGNVTQSIATITRDGVAWTLVAFPVKPVHADCKPDKSNVVAHKQVMFHSGQRVPGWACVARMDIIRKSARQLVELADKHGWQHVILPRPGCGAGELSWEQVKPELHKILDDRFYCITFPERK